VFLVQLIPRDPEAFSMFVAALVKGAKERRRGPKPPARSATRKAKPRIPRKGN